jgi:hypothetical protein
VVIPVKNLTYDLQGGVRWRGGIPFVFTGSHYFKLEKQAGDKTQFIQGEDFKGIAVWLLLPLMRKTLHTLYHGGNGNIKGFCETG